jgi:predicted transcriptional regulator
MNVLLSIRPEYSRKIFSGEKRYEFRKRKPNEDVQKVFVYESRPSKRIVGWFSLRTIHSGSPEKIWQMCSNYGGIKPESYFAYCKGRKIIHALEINETFRFEYPLNPYESIYDFKPPQDFAYCSTGNLDRALKEKELDNAPEN